MLRRYIGYNYLKNIGNVAISVIRFYCSVDVFRKRIHIGRHCSRALGVRISNHVCEIAFGPAPMR